MTACVGEISIPEEKVERATLRVAMAFVAGYVAGSVPLGLIVGKAFAGIDIRRYGTGGIGASNVRRNVGLTAAGVVALGIFLQGLLPPLAVRWLGGTDAVVVAAAMGAVVGYGWPVFMGFDARGSRGVGLSTGAAAAIFPAAFIPLVVVAFGLGWLLKQMALANLVGFIVYAGWTIYFAGPAAVKVGAALILAMLVLRRFAGIGEDLGRGTLPSVVANRLLFDRRPGQRLAGSSDG